MAGEDEVEELRDLRYALQRDRLIKVYAGDNVTPYLIPASTLTRISKVFGSAIKHEDSFGGASGVLRLPEEDQTAWELLLYWIFEGKFLCKEKHVDSKIIQLVRCWTLGDKYDIKEFQDLIMLELLRILNVTLVSLDAVKLAFENTPAGSPMRELIARQTVASISVGDCTTDELNMFDGVAGFVSELAAAYEILTSDPQGYRLLRDNLEEDRWRCFMVGAGPTKHWIYEE